MIPTSVFTRMMPGFGSCVTNVCKHVMLSCAVFFRWVTWNQTRMKVLCHDCVTMLGTRFVVFTGNFVIRRCSISKILWMMSTVSSCFRTVPARSSGSFREFTNFTMQIVSKNIVLASWLACVWSLELEDRLTFPRSSPSCHRVFSLSAQLWVVPPRPCGSRGWFNRESFFERLKSFWNLMRPVSPCLDTWEMQSVARCLPWVLQALDIGLKNFSRPVL